MFWKFVLPSRGINSHLFPLKFRISPPLFCQILLDCVSRPQFRHLPEPQRSSRLSSLSLDQLFPFRAAAHSKFANIQHENIQLCLLNNNGIMFLHPVALGLHRLFKRAFQEQQWRRHFYASRTGHSCNEAALNQMMCRFTITNRMSQAHKSDRCFVYFPG